jgi:hypothetical protein
MKASDSGISMTTSDSTAQTKEKKKPTKPHFVPAKDDTKPVLQDPVLFLSAQHKVIIFRV